MSRKHALVLAAYSAILIFVLIVLPYKANAASPGECRSTGYTNAYAQSGGTLSLNDLMMFDNEFETSVCWKNNMRMYMARANTPSEYLELQLFVETSKYEPGLIFCTTGRNKGYMLGLRAIFADIQPTSHEYWNFPRVAEQWMRNHNCTM